MVTSANSNFVYSFDTVLDQFWLQHKKAQVKKREKKRERNPYPK